MSKNKHNIGYDPSRPLSVRISGNTDKRGCHEAYKTCKAHVLNFGNFIVVMLCVVVKLLNIMISVIDNLVDHVLVVIGYFFGFMWVILRGTIRLTWTIIRRMFILQGIMSYREIIFYDTPRPQQCAALHLEKTDKCRIAFDTIVDDQSWYLEENRLAKILTNDEHFNEAIRKFRKPSINVGLFQEFSKAKFIWRFEESGLTTERVIFDTLFELAFTSNLKERLELELKNKRSQVCRIGDEERCTECPEWLGYFPWRGVCAYDCGYVRE